MYIKYVKEIVNQMITSEEYRFRIQTIVISSCFGFIGFVMFIVNVVTKTTHLIIFTGLMGIVGFLMTIYTYMTKKIIFSKILISLVFFVSMIYFMYSGGIDGFSPYWLLLLPYLSFFFYDFKLASTISLTTMFFIAITLWTPLKNYLGYKYSNSFYTRFPILYISCFLTAISTEYVKNHTFIKLKETVSKLDKLSRHDDLTKLENRRAFEMHVNDLWHIFSHKENCITILIVDIDNFKNYNDYYGHLKGDEVLIKVANLLKDQINSSNGYISRWGGEEFICLLPFTNYLEGKIIANKLVNTVSNSNIPHEKTLLSEKIITISVGGASTNIGEDHDSKLVIDAADKSLYEAKNSGKNKSGTIHMV